MIAFIKGKIEEFGEDYVVVDCQGIGYTVHMSMIEIEKLKSNKEPIKLFTHQQFREDYVGLFGFLDKEKLNLFKLLLSVSGVGPKAAISITSELEPQGIVLAILTNDDKTLCKAQGVGKKLAQRIILELKDKFKNYDFMEAQNTELTGANTPALAVSESNEAMGALMALGYTRQEAVGALRNVDRTAGLEEIVKQALKALLRG